MPRPHPQANRAMPVAAGIRHQGLLVRHRRPGCTPPPVEGRGQSAASVRREAVEGHHPPLQALHLERTFPYPRGFGERDCREERRRKISGCELVEAPTEW